MSTSVGGYVCPTCGVWVLPGTSHYCFGTGIPVGQPLGEARAIDPHFTLQEIATQLRRIADALEKA